MEKVKLGDVLLSIKSGLNPRKFFKLNTQDAKNYYITVKEIVNGHILPTNKTDKINDEALKLCSNRSHLEVGDVLFTGTGTIGNTALIKEPPVNWNIKEGVYALKPNTDLITSDYLFYLLQTESLKQQYENLKAGGTVQSISMKKMNGLKLSVPSLTQQKQITGILDTFTELIHLLELEIELRERQFENYRERFILQPSSKDTEIRELKLKDIGAIRMCRRILKRQTSDTGDVPFFKIKTFGSEPDAFISKELFDEYKEKYPYPKMGDVLISAAGTIGKTVEFNGKDAYFQDSNIVWIDNDESQVLNRYLMYFYQSKHWHTDVGGTIQRLYNKDIERAVIKVPDLQTQAQIATTLDTLTELIATIKKELDLRQKQYEYYRNLLMDGV